MVGMRLFFPGQFHPNCIILQQLNHKLSTLVNHSTVWDKALLFCVLLVDKTAIHVGISM